MFQTADCEKRLRALTHHMLRGFPGVRRWDQTDDILQEALIRLNRALSETPPESDVHFLRLAALQIRRVLIDLARRYNGRDHFAANHETWGDRGVERLEQLPQQTENDGLSLIEWSEFHEQVETLPPTTREVLDLIWYMGLSQSHVADMLGITQRTVQRRWRQARLLLHQRLAHGSPPID